MDTKLAVATDIALQSRVLRRCTKHDRLYLVDADPAPAFQLALKLLKQSSDRVKPFRFDWHELTDMICNILGKAPAACPGCRAALLLSWEARAVAWTDLMQQV